MEYGLIHLDEILKNYKAITFHHVRIKADSLVDRLANEGVCCNSALNSGNLNSLDSKALLMVVNESPARTC